jgi:hypothetical protein
MPHLRRVLWQGVLFYLLLALGLGLLTRNWHVAVHGSFAIAIPVLLWLEARISCRRP